MTRTYVDSGVLIAAARGNGGLSKKAPDVIADVGQREFVCSDYVKLETMPKPVYFGRTDEVVFYETFFQTVASWIAFDESHLHAGFDEACRSGLSSMDAIHIAIAAAAGCEELITSEKPTSAIHRSKAIRIISIDTP